MRFSPILAIIAACAALATLSSPAFAATSCPGGGSLVNCKAHCTIARPPVCTEECECAIVKGKIGGYGAAAFKRGNSGSTGPTRLTPIMNEGGGGRHH